MRNLKAVFNSPFLRRLTWHAKRIGSGADRTFFRSLLLGLFVILTIVAIVIWIGETDRTLGDLGAAYYWAVTTVLGQGDASYVSGPVGWLAGWALGLFGVAIVATITGALVGFIIDFLLKEGQGMGASGYSDHIIICGWNATARDLVHELSTDEYEPRVVLLHDSERNPSDDKVYFVKGSATNDDDLRRAGIDEALVAVVCPVDGSDQADMTSILSVLAIETLAPQVRTVVEVNNPAHVPHFRRAEVDEVIVTSRLASHLLARTALYPGLSELVTDIVSGGEGSELYRVRLPEDCVGMPIDDVAARLRRDHGATIIAVGRGPKVITNPEPDFTTEAGDALIVIAESLGVLSPLVNAAYE